MTRLYARNLFYPRTRLSIAAAREEFITPSTSMADFILSAFDLVWATYPDGEVSQIIYHHELHYPYGVRPATKKEISIARAARKETSLSHVRH